MNELYDLKSNAKADHGASPEKQTWLVDAVGSTFHTFKERPLESAGGALAAATLGVASLRLKAPALEKLATSEAVSLAKTRLQFDKFPVVPAGKLAIPSFRTEGGPLRDAMRTVPELNIVAIESTDARVYNAASKSTFEVFKGSNTRASTGFLVDESGLIATANHVVEKPELSYFVRIGGEKVPARLMARDVGNDVAVLKVDGNLKGIRPLELTLDAYSKESGALNSGINALDAGIKLDRTAFLIGFPDGAVQRVMTKGPAATISLLKNLSPEARIIDGEKAEFFRSARVMHRATSFGGNSGGPLLLENALVVGVHTNGRTGEGFARATSVHHLARLLDEVRVRPMVSGFGDYTTPVFVTTTQEAKQIVRRSAPAKTVNPLSSSESIKPSESLVPLKPVVKAG